MRNSSFSAFVVVSAVVMAACGGESSSSSEHPGIDGKEVQYIWCDADGLCPEGLVCKEMPAGSGKCVPAIPVK